MKASLSILASLVAALPLVTAQFTGFPTCGLTCAFKYVVQTGCTTSDIRCLCASNFVTLVAPCAQKACSAGDYDKTAQAAQSLCSATGVTLTLPSSSSTMTSTSSSSSSGSTTTSTTTTSGTTTTTIGTGSTSTTFAEATSSPTPSSGVETFNGSNVYKGICMLAVVVGGLLVGGMI